VTAAALLRYAGTAVLALFAAWAFDRLTRRRGFDPPGFASLWRRALAFLAVALVLWAGVFAPLAEIGRRQSLDLAHLTPARLFALHELMLAAIAVWFLAGFAGVRRRTPAAPVVAYPPPTADLPSAAPPPSASAAAELPPAVEAPPPPPRVSLLRQLAVQLGLATPSVGREVGLGLALGIVSWMAVIVAAALVAVFLIYGLGAKDALPKQPPEAIVWLAGLPFGLRLLLALSAGVVEEGFFRGLLQPRIGIVLSTGMFILAHTVYGQPFLLLGVGILSLIYALVVRWRRSIWSTMAAHAVFDGVQLLVVIPAALKMIGGKLPVAHVADIARMLSALL
jgi:membrane protease YdiL (CAAX protease family)